MITLITGVPGASKSLMAMEILRDAYEENLAASKRKPDDPKFQEPRTFWTDIDGATTEDNPKAFPWLQKMPSDYDWRLLPRGAFIVIDEAHQDHKFPEEGQPGQRAKDKKIRDLDESRHAGKDLVFITQHPTKVHREIRQLVGEHIHLTRGSGLGVAMVHRWSGVQTGVKEDSVLAKGDPTLKMFDKSLYERYFSSSMHTASHSFKIPMKWWGALCALVVGIGCIWFVYSHFIMGMSRSKRDSALHSPASGQGPAAQPAAASALGLPPGFTQVPNPDAPATPEQPIAQAPRPAACLQVRECKCWDTTGARMKISKAQCTVYLHDFGYISMRNAIEQTNPIDGALQSQSLAAAVVGHPAATVISTPGVGGDIPPPASAPVSAGASDLTPLR